MLFIPNREQIHRNLYEFALRYQNSQGSLNELLYTSELNSHGADYYAFYPAGTDQAVLSQAESEARHRFDVTSFTAIEILPEWSTSL